jgi:hypothetical protein
MTTTGHGADAGDAAPAIAALGLGLGWPLPKSAPAEEASAA